MNLNELKPFFKTFTHKSNSWKSETTMALGDSRRLKISTFKTFSGTLCTIATVCKVERGFETFVMYEDLNVRLAEQKVRVTQKAVETQHQGTLNNEEVISRLLNGVRGKYFPNIAPDKFVEYIQEIHNA